MSDTDKTIAHSAQTKTVIKKSSFLGFAIPLADEQQAQDILRDYRKRFHDARHICYAYILRPTPHPLITDSNGKQTPQAPASPSAPILKSSDGGEPTGTAGRPILGAIQSAEMENVMVVVVRYFGGVLLGAPGLIAAYREAARSALETAGAITKTDQCHLTLRFPYSQMNAVMQILKQHSVSILSNQSDMQCTLTVEAPPTIVATIAPLLDKVASVEI